MMTIIQTIFSFPSDGSFTAQSMSVKIQNTVLRRAKAIQTRTKMGKMAMREVSLLDV
jgi:hypothetical protein